MAEHRYAVLVVADVREHRELWKELLRREDYVPIEADTAAALHALDACADDPKIVLIDLDGVAASSLALVRAIRSRPNAPSLLVVSHFEHERESVIDAGADGFFCKPHGQIAADVLTTIALSIDEA